MSVKQISKKNLTPSLWLLVFQPAVSPIGVSFFMKAKNIEAASKVVTEPQILINMVSRRVRQLNAGSRPLIDADLGEGFADIALQEIAQGKLSLVAEGETLAA